MNLSCAKLEVDNEAVFNAMNVQWRTRILEYAAVIIFMLKFGVAYLPDYCLSYIDYKTDFEPYYGDEQDINLKRQKSSLMRQNSLGRANSLKKEESKNGGLTLGRGRKTLDLISEKKARV